MPTKEHSTTLYCKDCDSYWDKSNFSHHGKTTAGTQKYKSRCKKCYGKYATVHYAKEQSSFLSIAESFKVQCKICSYNKYKGALDFHHIDPKQKLWSISEMIRFHNSKNITAQLLIEEINKCVVLCSNCHREVHGNVLVL